MAHLTRRTLGERVAPPRFLLFGAVLVGTTVAAAGALRTDTRTALLIGFDVAVLIFLGAVIPLLRADPETMRRTAKANDANRVVVLAITVLLSLVILVVIGTLITSSAARRGEDVALIVITLILTWTFANIVFALHYAHLFYLQSGIGDRRGLEIPHAREPGYWDFLYFSFTLGMTFQTSDITIDGLHMRKVALVHCIVAFHFNIGILAFAVNALAGR